MSTILSDMLEGKGWANAKSGWEQVSLIWLSTLIHFKHLIRVVRASIKCIKVSKFIKDDLEISYLVVPNVSFSQTHEAMATLATFLEW